MSHATLIQEIKLFGTENGVISVSHLTQPYGGASDPVVSIGVSLDGDAGEPEWKAHIPYENIDALIAALQDAKAKHG